MSSGLEDMTAERQLLSRLLLPALQRFLRLRHITFDWTDLYLGGVKQAAGAAAAFECIGKSNGQPNWFCRGLKALEKQCALPLSSLAQSKVGSELFCNEGVSIPFTITLLGENVGPRLPNKQQELLLGVLDEPWARPKARYKSEISAASQDPKPPDFSSVLGSDDSANINPAEIRSLDILGTLELETTRAWLRYPVAACEGLVSAYFCSECKAIIDSTSGSSFEN